MELQIFGGMGVLKDDVLGTAAFGAVAVKRIAVSVELRVRGLGVIADVMMADTGDAGVAHPVSSLCM